MLCDAFCPTHSAATSQRHAPAPRQRCIFLKTNSHSSSSKSERTQAVKGRGGEQQCADLLRSHSAPPSPPACAPPLSGAQYEPGKGKGAVHASRHARHEACQWSCTPSTCHVSHATASNDVHDGKRRQHKTAGRQCTGDIDYLCVVWSSALWARCGVVRRGATGGGGCEWASERHAHVR